jgi:hypothetical protein
MGMDLFVNGNGKESNKIVSVHLVTGIGIVVVILCGMIAWIAGNV